MRDDETRRTPGPPSREDYALHSGQTSPTWSSVGEFRPVPGFRMPPADILAQIEAHNRDASSSLSAQDLAWMDEWAARCRVPYAEMSPDEARKVTAFAAMWFVPALKEVHRLRAAILHYADQRKRYPRSGAEIHAFGKLLATVEATPPSREAASSEPSYTPDDTAG